MDSHIVCIQKELYVFGNSFFYLLKNESGKLIEFEENERLDFATELGRFCLLERL